MKIIYLLLLILCSCVDFEIDNQHKTGWIIYDHASNDIFENTVEHIQKMKAKLLLLSDTIGCAHASLLIKRKDTLWQITTSPNDTIIIKQFDPKGRNRYYQEVYINNIESTYQNAIKIQKKGIIYDYSGAICSLSPISLKNKSNRLFCSEFVALLLNCDKPHNKDMLELYIWAKSIETEIQKTPTF